MANSKFSDSSAPLVRNCNQNHPPPPILYSGLVLVSHYTYSCYRSNSGGGSVNGRPLLLYSYSRAFHNCGMGCSRSIKGGALSAGNTCFSCGSGFKFICSVNVVSSWLLARQQHKLPAYSRSYSGTNFSKWKILGTFTVFLSRLLLDLSMKISNQLAVRNWYLGKNGCARGLVRNKAANPTLSLCNYLTPFCASARSRLVRALVFLGFILKASWNSGIAATRSPFMARVAPKPLCALA